MIGNAMLDEAFIRARNHARVKVPYFGPELFTLTPVIVKGLGTLSVDKSWRLYIDPDYFMKLSEDERIGILVHEMYHPLSLHFIRAERQGVNETTKLLWNIAADLEINQKVVADGMILPTGGVFPKQYNFPEELIAEEYFRLLLELPAIEKSGRKATSGSGESGSGVSGLAEPHELPENDPETDGVFGHERIHKASNALRREQDAKARGSNPLLSELIAELSGTPKVPWGNVLRNLIRRSVVDLGKTGAYRSFRRPSRRAIGGSIIMPRYFNQTYRIGIVLDTSGSMHGDPITEAYREVSGLCSHAGKCTVVCCDADSAPAQEVFGGNAHNLKLMGGGGTDMRVGISHFKRKKQDVDVVVVITDGDTPWPTKENLPKFNLIAVIVGDGLDPPQHIPSVRVE